MRCRDCGESFVIKRIKEGFIDQCDNCSLTALLQGDDVQRYIGRRTDKHGDVEIFRKDIEAARAHIKRENRIGMNPNLGVSNPIYESKKQDKE